MIKFNSYSDLGTSNKRKESERDHKMLKVLMENQWPLIRNFSKKSVDEIQDFQFRRIQQLVTHAFNTVGLYHEKYTAVGFEPGDLKNWEDFQKIPILEKNELIEGFPKKTISNKYDTEFTTRSSGSSGRFVTLTVSPEAIYMDTIQGIRQFHFQSRGKYFPTDLALFIYTSPWWVSSINGEYPTDFLPTTTKIEDAIKRIETTKPKILSVYPTYLMKIAEKGPNLKASGIELIVIHSEQSTMNERQALEKQFKVPVLDEFSSEELTRIAIECPNRRYHLEEDACYIEVVNPSTKKLLKQGNTGLVVGTNLLNEATPIIRYSQGDLAAIVGNVDCECRSNFRVMESPKGRFMDSITTNKGELIPASCFMDLAYNWYLELDVPVHGLRYQIIQNQIGDVNIFIIEGLYKLSHSQKHRIRNSLFQLLPENTEIGLHIVEEPPYNGGTKYRPIVSLMGKGDRNGK